MKLIPFLTLILIVALSYSCNNEDDTSCPECLTSKTVIIEDNITQNTVWHSDSIYIIKAWDFYVTATLTIQSGTIVKFTADGPFMATSGEGTIIANGTGSAPIVFTSYKDDSHGGDNNGDGSASQPSVNDWSQILVQTNGCSFEYCIFSYGGGGSYLNTLSIYGANATIENCTFIFNRGGKSGDFYIGALDLTNALQNTLVRNNVFYNNELPLSVESVIQIDNSNTFHNPEDPSQINTMNGIFIYSYDDINRAVAWEETEVPFVINDNDLWIESGASLTLAEDVVIKFTSGSGLVIDANAVLNQNNSNSFTSFKDDTKSGDTNGDGNATSPMAGDWVGIYDNSLSIPSPYFFQWPNIYYDSY